jgi:hypothetical protein
MATKSKAASAAKKAAPKKPEPIESVTVDARQDGAVIVINGREYSLSVQGLLGLRAQINDQAAGLVH